VFDARPDRTLFRCFFSSRAHQHSQDSFSVPFKKETSPPRVISGTECPSEIAIVGNTNVTYPEKVW
jgi:hypothetical protein